jgi:arylsulfatase A-like enzyme
MTSLVKEEIRDNTIVVFTTDNGTGSAGYGNNIRLGRLVTGGKASKGEQNGTAQPFIVNCPSLVPAGVITDALVDFTDILPTFAELGGGTLPDNRVVDGKSFAPLILGKADDSPRDWILSMGGGSAVLRDGRVRPSQTYDDRVIRGKRFKLWIASDRHAVKLFDLQNDPWEENNLVDSSAPEIVAAKHRLMKVVEQFPLEDAAPAYTPNPPQSWDKKWGQL